jgi:aldose sugar dehydrogenase
VRVRRRVGAALAVLCIGSIFAACVPAKPPAKEPPPPGPQLPPPPPDQGPPPNSPTLSNPTNVVTGLSNPWDLAFIPGGDANKFFYTQRAGPVRLHTVSPPPVPDVDVLIVSPGDVQTGGESGMNGIAVDPNYASNKFIYTYYATASDNRIIRWHVNATETGTDGSTIIASGIPRSNMHDGGRVRFGPDGKLWFTTGDASTGPLPQDLSQLGGKTARINSNGTTPGDNPFVGQPGIDDRIWTYGHRNPQGLAFRSDGVPYTSEHGPNINDEVNQLVPGGNSGWDPNTNGTYDQSVPMTDLQKFPNAMIPAWRSGDSFTLAPSGATFLTGAQWKSWDGQLLVVFLKDSEARVMFLDGNGNISFATPILDNGVRLRSAVQGPDGNLYISTDTGGGNDVIYKVVPS